MDGSAISQSRPETIEEDESPRKYQRDRSSNLSNKSYDSRHSPSVKDYEGDELEFEDPNVLNLNVVKTGGAMA